MEHRSLYISSCDNRRADYPIISKNLYFLCLGTSEKRSYNFLQTVVSKREVPSYVRNSKSPETRQVHDRLVSTLEHMASSKVGQDQVSGGVTVLCWHATPVAYVPWKPCTIR